MYGKIISFLFFVLIIYYVVMIFLDFRKEKAVKAAELEKNAEEEIDISDEAQTFKPVLISRDIPPKPTVPPESSPDSGETANIQKNQSDNSNNNKDTTKVEDNKDITKVEDNKSVDTSEDNQQLSEPPGTTEPPVSKDAEESVAPPTLLKNEEKPSPSSANERPFRRAGYREAAMTGGLDVPTLLQEVDQWAETGTGPLGQVIFDCQSAHF